MTEKEEENKYLMIAANFLKSKCARDYDSCHRCPFSRYKEDSDRYDRCIIAGMSPLDWDLEDAYHE